MSKYFKIFFVFILSLVFILPILIKAEVNSSPDAIAIRVLPNAEHFNILRWYNSEGFKGSPQLILIDDYEAIRDGRTVYVNAANIDSNNLYTNIYLISYNQDAESATLDIFGEILSHWKFNINLTEVGVCSEDSEKKCFYDYECGDKRQHCLSDKAETIRDVKRLGDLVEIKILLENFLEKEGHYPILRSGTYLPNKTLSVWPSWKSNLFYKLGVKPIYDPVNKLGDCGDDRFNFITCWDEKTKEFADGDLSTPELDLPPDSYIYFYSAAEDGSSYEACSIMESGYVSGVDGGDCASSEQLVIHNVRKNHQPVFLSSEFPISNPFSAYEGYIKAYDPDGDNFTWTMNLISSWNAWLPGDTIHMRSGPVSHLEVEKGVQHKKFYADTCGDFGTYTFSITLDDGRGLANSLNAKNFSVLIDNTPPRILVPGIRHVVSSTNPLIFNIKMMDEKIDYPLTYSFPTSLIAGLNVTNFNMDEMGSYYNLGVEGITSSSDYPLIVGEVPYSQRVRGINKYNRETTRDFEIILINHAPEILSTESCSGYATVGEAYPPCKIEARDIDGHQFSFSLSSAPAGLIIDSGTGIISGTPSVSFSEICVQVTDEYGQDSLIECFNVEPCREQVVDFTINTIADGLIFDNDANYAMANDEAPNNYLKLSSSMPTPYIWLADARNNEVIKMRTFDGLQKTRNFDGDGLINTGISELEGNFLGAFKVGFSPSRTAVNAGTGDVWIANRGYPNTLGDTTITKLDVDGNHLKTCETQGEGARPVVIDRHGDVWVGNYESNNLVKISGDDLSCNPLVNLSVLSPYGAAIDANDNIWIVNGLNCSVTRVNTETLDTKVFDLRALSNCGTTNSTNNYIYAVYGITVDTYNNVWVADLNTGIYKINTLLENVEHFNFSSVLNPPYGRSRGVSVDSSGGI